MNSFSLKSLFVAVAVVEIACWMIRSFHPLGTLSAFLFITACGGFVFAKRKRTHVVLGGLALLIIGGLGFDMVSNSHRPVPADRIQRIQPGTTKAEVEALLGKPDRIRWRGRNWIYSDNTWCKVTVRFSAHGRVDYVYHDR